MAFLYVEEFAQSGFIAGSVPVGAEPSNTTQKIAIAAGSAQSNAFASNTNLVRLHTDAICSYAFGLNPTASATTNRMNLNTTEYFQVTPGHKVAVITNT